MTEPAAFVPDALVDHLNALLENERAVLRVLRTWSLEAGHSADIGAWTLAAMRDDSTSICARLWDYLSEQGAEPASGVGAFHDAALALSAWPDRLRRLDDSFASLQREIGAMMPRIADPALITLLREALARHDEARSQMTGIRGQGSDKTNPIPDP